ncbi:MAG: putative toxin-antitoxin system toxin component, PIN family [Chloroflexota bacterium]
MRAALDVGQFVSATINQLGHPAQILRSWQEGAFELATSPAILDDLCRALGYPRIRKRHQWSDLEIDAFVEFLALAADVTTGDPEGFAVIEADPSDDKILACAVEGAADYIVASDEHLIGLGSFRGIPIVPPRRFLEILTEERERLGRISNTPT